MKLQHAEPRSGKTKASREVMMAETLRSRATIAAFFGHKAR